MTNFETLVSLAEGMAQGSTENTNKFWREFRHAVEGMVKTGLRYRYIVEGGLGEDFIQEVLLYVYQKNFPRLRSGEWTPSQFIGYSLNRVKLKAGLLSHGTEHSSIGLSFDGCEAENGVVDLDTIGQGHWVSARKVGTPEREFFKKTVRTELESVVGKMNDLEKTAVQTCCIEGRPPRALSGRSRETNKLTARVRYRVRVELARAGIEGDYLARS